jgi:indole-3-glycerol phosphate synthase
VSLLARILAAKEEEIVTMTHLAAGEAPGRDVLDVVSRLRRREHEGEALRLVAEVKFKSPSAGDLSRALDAGARAVAYAEAGAAMVSVLCDATFFGGSWGDLARAHAALRAAGHEVPVLAKEFVIDESQVARAEQQGADAVLLIARILPDGDLERLARYARSRCLEPLVEVTDEAELERALACGATLVGVNARDLDTLQMDAARAERVLARVPPDKVALHLSGLKTPQDVASVALGRADAALVGEALMRLDDPAPLLAQMAAAAKTGRSARPR